MTETQGRPLVTFALFAYNQERFIEEAVAGAFAQDYSPLEIILSDDCSTDATFEIMKRMADEYRGPHKIVLNRNERNLGIPAHVNRVFSLAEGALVIMGAGDDISDPSRASMLVDAWRTGNCIADCVFSDCNVIDDQGKTLEHRSFKVEARKEMAAVARHGTVVLGAVAAWTQRLFDEWGPIGDDAVAEDSILTVRAALSGGLCHVGRPLVRYRAGSSSWNAGNSSKEAVAQKGKQLARLILSNAKAALSAFERHGEASLIALAKERVRAAEAYVDIHHNKRLRGKFLLESLRSGARLKALAIHVSYKIPIVYLTIKKLKNSNLRISIIIRKKYNRLM